jgi:hypothetical protein
LIRHIDPTLIAGCPFLDPRPGLSVRLGPKLGNSITFWITSSADSRTTNFWPVVSAITVSGVASTCSISSEFKTNGTLLMRVSRIMERSQIAYRRANALYER